MTVKVEARQGRVHAHICVEGSMRVEMTTCPNWVLSYEGKAEASPTKETSGCRWCPEVGVMPPVASDSSLRS